MKSFRAASPAAAPIAALLLVSLFATPLLGETRTAAQRDQNRIVSEIRQIQVQLATLVEAQTALSQAVEALLTEREEQLTADRQSRAETMNTLERMERSVSTLSEAFRDTNERLSALMVEVESVREAQRRAALLGGGSGEGEDTAPPDGEEAQAPEAAAGDESSQEEGSGEEEATVLDEPSVSEIYLQADADYLQGRYDLALAGFERVAESGGELADNARYFMGECRLAQDRLDDALEQFDIVIRDFPDSSKIGEAWYKKGLIFGRMGHESDAREIFEDILDVFAGTTAARLAQRELDAMPPRDPGR
ncbi:MAG: tetratricopeptide repeat protein [Acidobacteria bacterium]|nr:tetratricopeptide repeat protein [Acidobacteriota bacterium]MYA47091.1 tetratricopeptide repeat protein [Acidobacteriota bacterium]MYH23087.1 tetratricopeptide repeat protein [Acidobacteriota bacterium]MYK79754.1 tetratricopeptide repeat protein [Acidobacteriota bacterium]